MLRDDNRHLKEQNAALKEEIERMRRLLFGSGSEKLEKGDWIVNVDEVPAASKAQEQSQAEPTKPAEKPKESEESRKPRLKVHLTRRVWHEMVPEEVQDAPEKYQRLPKSSDVVSRRIEKIPAHLQEEIYVCPRFVRRGGHTAARLHDGSERGGNGHPQQVRAAPAALPTDQRV